MSFKRILLDIHGGDDSDDDDGGGDEKEDDGLVSATGSTVHVETVAKLIGVSGADTDSASGGGDGPTRSAARVDPLVEYELLEEIGRGGFGQVCKARRRADNVEVAVKRIPLKATGDVLSKVGAEVRMLRLCAGAGHVVQFVGTFLNKQEVWIVLELMELGSLRRIMDMLGRPLTEPEISRVCGQTVLGLVAVHRHRMIHRDCKADNILINRAGVCKLADFGTANTFDTLEKRNTATGSLFWMAPEVTSEQEQDERCDVWSLAITAIDLAQGVPPFFDMLPLRAAFLIARDSAPLPFFSEPDKFSPVFQAFVRRCLVRNPTQRPHSQDLVFDPFLQPLLPESPPSTDAAAGDAGAHHDLATTAESVDAANDVLRALADKAHKEAQIQLAAEADDESAQQTRLMELLQRLDAEIQQEQRDNQRQYQMAQQKQVKGLGRLGGGHAANDGQNSMMFASKSSPTINGSAARRADNGDEWQREESSWSLIAGPNRNLRTPAVAAATGIAGAAVMGSKKSDNLGMATTTAVASGRDVLRASEGFVMVDSSSSSWPDDWPQHGPISVRRLVEMMRDPVYGLGVRDRSYRLRTFPSCFVGSDFVDWCMKQPALGLMTRDHALVIGQTLMFRGVIEHVVRQHAFQDKKLFYHFTEDVRARAVKVTTAMAVADQSNSGSRRGSSVATPSASAAAAAAVDVSVVSSADMATDPSARRVERLIAAMRDPKTGVQRKDRQVFLHRLRHCFAGSDVVSWLLFQRLGLRSRRAACELLQLLMQRGFFFPLTHSGKNVFKDSSTSYYRFYLDDEKYFSKQVADSFLLPGALTSSSPSAGNSAGSSGRDSGGGSVSQRSSPMRGTGPEAVGPGRPTAALPAPQHRRPQDAGGLSSSASSLPSITRSSSALDSLFLNDN